MVGEIKPSLVSNSHSSEGFLVSTNGIVYHIFRQDTTENSDHISNTGQIVFRKSYNKGDSWSNVKTIYDSKYDDRNIHGGLNSQGNIVIFFRRIDVQANHSSYQTIDHNYIIFDPTIDTILSISKMDTPTGEDNLKGSTGTNKIFYVPDKGYFTSFYHNSNINFQFSDGIEWNNFWNNAYDFRNNDTITLDENCFVYIGDNTIIGLSRDQSHGSWPQNGSTANYFQLVSFDNGDSWKFPERTNIGFPTFTPSPCIFIEENTQKIICISSTRPVNTFNSHISVYTHDIDSVSFHPKGYKLISQKLRPDPNSKHFYGYPTYARLDQFSYLVVFSESYYKSNGWEGSHLYQFKISIE